MTTPPPVRIRGIVRSFKAEKGFGFIVAEGLPDIFVHFAHVLSDRYRILFAGEHVEFACVETPRGLMATEVILVGEDLEKARATTRAFDPNLPPPPRRR